MVSDNNPLIQPKRIDYKSNCNQFSSQIYDWNILSVAVFILVKLSYFSGDQIIISTFNRKNFWSHEILSPVPHSTRRFDLLGNLVAKKYKM